MKLAIPTLNRPEAISTPFLDVFEGFDIYIIFHTELDKKKYEAVHDLSNFKLIGVVEKGKFVKISAKGDFGNNQYLDILFQ